MKEQREGRARGEEAGRERGGRKAGEEGREIRWGGAGVMMKASE